MVKMAVGWQGEVLWDTSKPDGTPRKLCDVSRLAALNWTYCIPLEEGLRQTVDWFLKQQQDGMMLRL
jgi:GDP-L-fucose synthase